MGLNDGRMDGGRDGWWLMFRQRRSLLCVTGAYKAASVCDGTERQGHTNKVPYTPHQRPSQTSIIFFPCFLSHLCPAACVPYQCYCTALRESSSIRCVDATSFSSHYVLIRGRYRGGGEAHQKQAEGCGTELHTRLARAGSSQSAASFKSLNALRFSFGIQRMTNCCFLLPCQLRSVNIFLN